jgi:hypothetical protein
MSFAPLFSSREETITNKTEKIMKAKCLGIIYYNVQAQTQVDGA